MLNRQRMFLTGALVAAILAVAVLFSSAPVVAATYDSRVTYNYPIGAGYHLPTTGYPVPYVHYRPIEYVVHYPNTWSIVYPQTVPYTMIGAQNAYYATRRQYTYGDRQEYYGFKRGPRLQSYPPYRAYGPEARPMGIPRVDLGWTSEGSLRVSWAQRPQPVRSVELAFIDQFGTELSRQTVTDLPLQTALTVPEEATDLRVTVNYADGGVSSSATRLPK